MATMKSYVDSPEFLDDTELSATLLNKLVKNADLIKHAVLAPSPVHAIHRVLFMPSGRWLWKGGFHYRLGLTTARFVVYGKEISGSGDNDIVFYLNGVERGRIDANIGGRNVGGFQTVELPIYSYGYTDFDIITVEVVIIKRGTGDPMLGTYYIFDAFVYPLSAVAISAYGGVPTFGSVNATNLTQLSNSIDAIAERVSLVPNPINTNVVKWMGTSNPRYPTVKYFKVSPTNNNQLFKTSIYYMCRQTSAKIRVTINSINFDFGPYTYGQNVTIPVSINLISNGMSYDQNYLGAISEVVLTPAPGTADGSFVFSRISIGPMYLESTGFSLLTTPTQFTMLESLSFSTLQTRLNALSAVVDEAYTRMNGTLVYNRAQMFRGRFALDAGQEQQWDTTLVPSIYRQGDVIWVKGQGLKIGYGPVTIKVKADSKPNDTWEYEYLYEEDLLDGDKISQGYFYLDQFKGLYPGMIYYIFGKEIIYAAEHLRLQ